MSGEVHKPMPSAMALKITEEINKQVEIQKLENQKILSQFIKESSKDLFDKWPNLKSYMWRQYTPHFNDGDECVFKTEFHPRPYLNDGYPYIDSLIMHLNEYSSEEVRRAVESPYSYEEQRWTYEHDGMLECKILVDIMPDVQNTVNKLAEIDKEIYLVALGDHVEVTVSRDKIELSHCNHE
jgi:hypothetical protein